MWSVADDMSQPPMGALKVVAIENVQPRLVTFDTLLITPGRVHRASSSITTPLSSAAHVLSVVDFGACSNVIRAESQCGAAGQLRQNSGTCGLRRSTREAPPQRALERAVAAVVQRAQRLMGWSQAAALADATSSS
jgi:hypothetical protein